MTLCSRSKIAQITPKDPIPTLNSTRITQFFFFTVYRVGVACIAGFVITGLIASNTDWTTSHGAQLEYMVTFIVRIYVACAIVLLPFFLFWVARNIEPPLRRFRWYASGIFLFGVVPIWFARQVAIGDKKLRESAKGSASINE